MRHFRRAKEAEELSREAAQQANRYVRCSYDDNGSMIVKASLPAEVGALFVKALRAAIDALPSTEDVSAETSNPPLVGSGPTIDMQRADALALIAESFLAHGAESLSGGDKHQIVVHVDAETLQRHCAGRCEFEEGAAMAAETARRVACDASIVMIVEDEHGNPLDIGRKAQHSARAPARAQLARSRLADFLGAAIRSSSTGITSSIGQTVARRS